MPLKALRQAVYDAEKALETAYASRIKGAVSKAERRRVMAVARLVAAMPAQPRPVKVAA